MSRRETHPIAWVIGVSGQELKARCPHCDQIHIHSAGLGHRAPHCASARVDTAWTRTGYWLAIPDALPAKTRAKVDKALVEGERIEAAALARQAARADRATP